MVRSKTAFFAVISRVVALPSPEVSFSVMVMPAIVSVLEMHRPLMLATASPARSTGLLAWAEVWIGTMPMPTSCPTMAVDENDIAVPCMVSSSAKTWRQIRVVEDADQREAHHHGDEHAPPPRAVARLVDDGAHGMTSIVVLGSCTAEPAGALPGR